MHKVTQLVKVAELGFHPLYCKGCVAITDRARGAEEEVLVLKPLSPFSSLAGQRYQRP